MDIEYNKINKELYYGGYGIHFRGPIDLAEPATSACQWVAWLQPSTSAPFVLYIDTNLYESALSLIDLLRYIDRIVEENAQHDQEKAKLIFSKMDLYYKQR